MNHMLMHSDHRRACPALEQRSLTKRLNTDPFAGRRRYQGYVSSGSIVSSHTFSTDDHIGLP